VTVPTVNREVIAAWVAALRSGRYRQGRGGLRGQDVDGPRYCCLGVLCELAVDAGIVHRDGNLYGVRRDGDGGYVQFQGAFLPSSVVGWAGLPGGDPYVVADDRASKLNDVERWSFDRIADALERRYLS
jgi:hypothetical protein